MGRASKGRDYDYGTYRESIFLTQYCGWLCHIRKHGSNCRFIGPVYIGVFLAKNSLIKGMSFTALGTGGRYRQYLNALIGAVAGTTASLGYDMDGPVRSTVTGYTVVGATNWASQRQTQNHTTRVISKSTPNNDTVEFVTPYIAVYFWRRTA